MQYAPYIRLGCFLGVLFFLAVWEVSAPRRKLTVRRPLRLASNLGLVALNTVAVRVAFALEAVGVSLVATERQWGLLNNVRLAEWLAVPTAVIALDFAIYLQHVLFHAVPVFWRLHMVHHADLDCWPQRRT